MSTDSSSIAQDRALRNAAWDEAAFARNYQHDVAVVRDGVRIHYVSGGSGPAVVLLHGFPQHWWEWRFIMPVLAEAGFTVIAPDLRGFGLSDKPLQGYDTGTVCEDIRQLAHSLGHSSVSIVGHDLGASVAYTWAAAHREEVKRLVLMEAFPAGLEPPSSPVPTLKGKRTWHLAFLNAPDIPEALLSGREHILVGHLFRNGAYDPTTFSEADVDAYARPFALPGGIRGALAHIRAMPESASLNRQLSAPKLSAPVLAIGAELSFGSGMEKAALAFAETVTGWLLNVAATGSRRSARPGSRKPSFSF